jgi:hypothetical protein
MIIFCFKGSYLQMRVLVQASAFVFYICKRIVNATQRSNAESANKDALRAFVAKFTCASYFYFSKRFFPWRENLGASFEKTSVIGQCHENLSVSLPF